MIGGIEETSASFEARSAPRSYPTCLDFRGKDAEQFAIAVTDKPEAERVELLHDHLRTRAILDDLAETHRDEFGRLPQLRHILLYLLFPDDYERIASEGHKARIVEAFNEIIEGETPDDVDDQLKTIRQRLTEFLPDQDLDFYWGTTTRTLLQFGLATDPRAKALVSAVPLGQACLAHRGRRSLLWTFEYDLRLHQAHREAGDGIDKAEHGEQQQGR
jgi:hypothetical protein